MYSRELDDAPDRRPDQVVDCQIISWCRGHRVTVLGALYAPMAIIEDVFSLLVYIFKTESLYIYQDKNKALLVGHKI